VKGTNIGVDGNATKFRGAAVPVRRTYFKLSRQSRAVGRGCWPRRPGAA